MSHSTTATPLNAEQAAAIDSLLQFIQDPDLGQWYFIFSGFAGTGKTYCMREVVRRCKGTRTRFAFTAPTNKAARVLRSVTGEACTIYSLLGLRMDKSGELKKLVEGKKVDLNEYDIIFIDEASMVNQTLFSKLEEVCMLYGLRVVFMGDAAQLPPVGEVTSPIWKLNVHATLNQVMRHDNQILRLVTEIRSVLGSPLPSVAISSNNDGNEGVWKMTPYNFKQHIYEAACNGAFADGSQSKVIAWRNVRVAEYNRLIRKALFGDQAVDGHFVVGDRVVAAAPCVRGEETLMITDEEAYVEKVRVCRHPMQSKYLAIELLCRTEENRSVRLLVLHPDSAVEFNNDAEHLAHDARDFPKLWVKFWNHKELFHDIRYAYALTAHRSQGSTYENVWVDYQDILYNRNRAEAFQCLYVACSRPTTRLYMA